MKTLAIALLTLLTLGCGGGMQPRPSKVSPPIAPTCDYPISQPAFCLTRYGTIQGAVGNSSLNEGFGWVIQYVGADGSDEGGSYGEMFPALGKIEKRAAGAWWNSIDQPNGAGTLPITFNGSAPGESYPDMSETVDSTGPNTISITLTARSCAGCAWYGWFYRVGTVQVADASENYFANTSTEATAYWSSNSVSLAGGCSATMAVWTDFSSVSDCGMAAPAALKTTPGVLFASSEFDMSWNGTPSSVAFVYTVF